MAVYLSTALQRRRRWWRVRWIASWLCLVMGLMMIVFSASWLVGAYG